MSDTQRQAAIAALQHVAADLTLARTAALEGGLDNRVDNLAEDAAFIGYLIELDGQDVLLASVNDIIAKYVTDNTYRFEIDNNSFVDDVEEWLVSFELVKPRCGYCEERAEEVCPNDGYCPSCCSCLRCAFCEVLVDEACSNCDGGFNCGCCECQSCDHCGGYTEELCADGYCPGCCQDPGDPCIHEEEQEETDPEEEYVLTPTGVVRKEKK